MASVYEIADFYRQLALLTKSELPLPEALRNLAEDARGSDMKSALKKLGEEIAKGRSLSDAMKDDPKVFPPFFTRLACAGEKSGALPEALGELASLARMNYQLATLVKDIAFYPLVTISFALLILILMSFFVIPQFGMIFNELLEGSRLPVITNFVLGIAHLIHDFIIPVSALYAIYLGFAVWLMLGKGRANKVLLSMIKMLPLSETVFYNLAMARVCALWSVMMKRKIPDSEALLSIAETSDSPELAEALKRAAEACAKGVPLEKALEDEKDLSRLLCLAVANNQEAALPEELQRLAELFKERANYGFRRTSIAWELVTAMGMGLVVCAVILILFTPLISKIFNL